MYSTDLIMLNRVVSSLMKVLSRDFNTPGGIQSSPGTLFTFGLYSTSFTSSTDILYEFLVYTTEALGGSLQFWYIVLRH